MYVINWIFQIYCLAKMLQLILLSIEETFEETYRKFTQFHPEMWLTFPLLRWSPWVMETDCLELLWDVLDECSFHCIYLDVSHEIELQTHSWSPGLWASFPHSDLVNIEYLQEKAISHKLLLNCLVLVIFHVIIILWNRLKCILFFSGAFLEVIYGLAHCLVLAQKACCLRPHELSAVIPQ